MLPLVPPAHQDAVVADEEAEAARVVRPILLLSNLCWPSCSVVLIVNHWCWPSTHCSCIVEFHVNIVQYPATAIVGTFPLSSITRVDKIPTPLLHCWRSLHFRRDCCHHLCWCIIFIDTLPLSHLSTLSCNHCTVATTIDIVVVIFVVLTPWPLQRTCSSTTPPLLPS